MQAKSHDRTSEKGKHDTEFEEVQQSSFTPANT